MSSKIRVCNVSERAFNWIKERAFMDKKSQKVVIDELIDSFNEAQGKTQEEKGEKVELDGLKEIEKELKKLDNLAS